MKLAKCQRRLRVAACWGILLGLSFLASVAAGAESLTDEQVRKRMIQDSIAAYPGACPCPYSLNRSGRKCGKNSAYSKPGGEAPLCNPGDISDDQVDKYRKRHKIENPKSDR